MAPGCFETIDRKEEGSKEGGGAEGEEREGKERMKGGAKGSTD